MAQRGESSSGSRHSGPHKRGPPGPRDVAKTVADLLVEMIDSQNTDVITRLSRAENCIRDIIAHMGTPSAIIPLVAVFVAVRGCKEVLQCSTLVDNVLSRHACKQCCDVQHVGLGYVGPFCVLPFLLPSVSFLYVPVRFLMVDLLLCFQKGSRYFEFPTL